MLFWCALRGYAKLNTTFETQKNVKTCANHIFDQSTSTSHKTYTKKTTRSSYSQASPASCYMPDALSAHFGVSSKHTVSSLYFDLHNVGKMEVGADSCPTLGDSHSCKDWDAVDSINA